MLCSYIDILFFLSLLIMFDKGSIVFQGKLSEDSRNPSDVCVLVIYLHEIKVRQQPP